MEETMGVEKEVGEKRMTPIRRAASTIK